MFKIGDKVTRVEGTQVGKIWTVVGFDAEGWVIVDTGNLTISYIPRALMVIPEVNDILKGML